MSSNFDTKDGVFMLQGIEEISHFRKSLGIFRNAWEIEEIPELPRHLQKLQTFLEMPRQLEKLLIFSYLFYAVPNSGKQQSD